MKKLFFILFFTVLSFSAFAQHADFKGIPIDGTVSSFKFKMANKGFLYKQTDGVDAFIGNFAGKEVTVLLATTKKTRTIYNVIVLFDSNISWTYAKNDYFEMYWVYSDKYGAPFYDKQEFEYPYEEGDGYEMTALRAGKCKYVSMFHIPNGKAMLTIMNDGRLAISYIDDANSEKNDKEDNSIVYDDI